MAVKIKKKRPEAPEEDENAILEEEDEILHASRETFDFLTDHRNAVIAGIAVLFISVVAGSMMLERRASASAEAASGIFIALAEANAAVGEGETYADVPARAAAVASSADAVIAEHEGDALGTTARLLAAHAALQQGEAGTAQSSFAAFRTARSGSPEANVAAFGEASAMAEAGDLAGALALLDTLGDDNEAMGFGASLQSARLVDAFGEPSAALDAYREVVAAYPERASQVFVEHRIAQLEIELNVEPVAADEPSDDEAAGDE